VVARVVLHVEGQHPQPHQAICTSWPCAALQAEIAKTVLGPCEDQVVEAA
jgi:hypothetical protein